MQNWAVQTSFLGDAVLTLPFIQRVLERDESLLLVAAPRNVAVFERAKQYAFRKWGSKLEIQSWDKKEAKGFLQIRRLANKWRGSYGTPERCYCIHRSFSTSLLALFSAAETRIGFSSGSATFFYTDLATRNWDNGQSEVEKNLDLLRLQKSCVPWAADSPSLLGERKPEKNVVAFSLGSPWGTKEWTPENAELLIKQLVKDGVEVWLLGDNNFAPKAESLEKKIESKLVKNFSGKTNIHEWIDLLARASAVVSGDSAAVHVASDLNVPVIALFGPTVTEFGFAPWRKNSKVLGMDLPCRPCDIHGPKICPLGHHNCMKKLSAEWVYSALKEWLT